MSWVFTSKRIRGSRGVAPKTVFAIGEVLIASISMHNISNKWEYHLHTIGRDDQYFPSFGAALKRLHEHLNAVAPEGYETGTPRKE